MKGVASRQDLIDECERYRKAWVDVLDYLLHTYGDPYGRAIPIETHKHIWHVGAQALQNSWVGVCCIDPHCGESRRLPVEVPK